MVNTVALFLRNAMTDNYETRYFLMMSCVMMIVANLSMFIGLSVAVMISDDLEKSLVARMVPTYILPCFVWLYFRIMCQQWMKLGADVGAQEGQ